MADYTFNTPSGQTIARELLIAYLNTGTAEEPVWSAIGKRTEESEAEFDWGEETTKDILGNTWTAMKKPVVTQSFDPLPLNAGDPAVQKIWQLAVVAQDAQALTAQDMLIVHHYAGTARTAVFAERYTACMIKPSSLGGEGGGSIDMPVDVTYGGERTTGTAAVSDTGVVTFTAA